MANSLYGVLGNRYFRLYKLDLGKSITLTGRELLKFAGYHISKYMVNGSLEVDSEFIEKFEDHKKYIIYGDTDSLYISISEYLSDKGINID